MKRINIILVVLFVIAGIFTIQSCSKNSEPEPVIYQAAMPALLASDSAVYTYSGTPETINLTWAGTKNDGTGNPIKWQVYFGTKANPPLRHIITGSNTDTVNVINGGIYYWQVITTDANHMTSTGPVWSFVVHSHPTTVVLGAPANNSTYSLASGSLNWTCSDPEGFPLTYDVYLGKTNTPGIVGEGISATTYTPTLSPNTVYYWKVVAHDPYGASSMSALHSFTTGGLAISAFAKVDTVYEPAEAYWYGATFTAKTGTTLSDNNYWNSGWVVIFTLDFVNLTYSMPFTNFGKDSQGNVYTGTEAGTIDPATGDMIGSYTIWENGKAIEQGMHTYQPKTGQKK